MKDSEDVQQRRYDRGDISETCNRGGTTEEVYQRRARRGWGEEERRRRRSSKDKSENHSQRFENDVLRVGRAFFDQCNDILTRFL